MVDITYAKTSSSQVSILMLELYSDTKSTLPNGFTSTNMFLFGILQHRETDGCRLPDNVSFAEGALLEPLSVVLHGINSAPITLGTPVVICGAGPIGLLALASARASGAHPLVITDVEPKRLAFAKELVPTVKTYQVDTTKTNEENGKNVRGLFGETEYVQPRVVFECTGIESSVCSAAFMVRRGGILMVVGVGRSIMNNLPFMHLSLAEVCARSYGPSKY
jgi:L-iditol 2-dehydrogenase